MLSILLKCLSILGIILLCLLGLLLAALLLVLFFPVCYRISGKKNSETLLVSARAVWLFGLLRARYDYPEPGKPLVKLLWFNIFPKHGKKRDAKKEKSREEKTQGGKDRAEAKQEEKAQEEKVQEEKAQEEKAQEEKTQEEKTQEKDAQASNPQGKEDSLKIFEKIKYTIHNIYDKIKIIWENISKLRESLAYYAELLRDEETKQLFSHAVFRFGRILKSIRPRHIRANVLFGTGAPDTTGYAYGFYGMLSPFLGTEVLVTPDFTQAILEGDFYASGHITVFTILWNGLKLLLDKKLRIFIRKLKAGRKN